MASQGERLQYISRRRLLGMLGALTLASCGGGDVGACTSSSSVGRGSVSSISRIHFEMRSDTVQLTLQWHLDDDITDLVNLVGRYGNRDQHNACNSNDGTYQASIVRTSTRDVADPGYVDVLTICLRF